MSEPDDAVSPPDPYEDPMGNEESAPEDDYYEPCPCCSYPEYPEDDPMDYAEDEPPEGGES